MINKEFLDLVSTPEVSIVDAMKKMDITGHGILFILDDEKLIGTLTDGDIRRWLIKTGNLKCDISAVMNKSPYTLRYSDSDKAEEYMKENRLRALPILDDECKLVDIVINGPISTKPTKNADSLKDVPVVIMAGGKGTRLYPYTKILPKPLIPIGDIPIIDRIMDSYHEYGAGEFFLVVNFMKNMIKAYENEVNHDYQIHFIDETEPLGTGGGLKLLSGKIHNTFVLSNCDTLIDDDFAKIVAFHKSEKNDITMICALKTGVIPYGVVNMGDNGSITSMEEKPNISYFTNTGCYIVEPSVIDMIGDGESIGFPTVINRVKDNGGRIKAYPISEQSWMDMGQFDSMDEMLQILKKRNKL